MSASRTCIHRYLLNSSLCVQFCSKSIHSHWSNRARVYHTCHSDMVQVLQKVDVNSFYYTYLTLTYAIILTVLSVNNVLMSFCIINEIKKEFTNLLFLLLMKEPHYAKTRSNRFLFITINQKLHQFTNRDIYDLNHLPFRGVTPTRPTH